MQEYFFERSLLQDIFFLDCMLHDFFFLSPWVAGIFFLKSSNPPPPSQSQMIRPFGTMLAVYRICMYDKMCHFAALICLPVDGHISFFGKWEIKNLLHFLTYFFIKKFTGHVCPPGDNICRSNCEFLPVSDWHLFRGLGRTHIYEYTPPPHPTPIIALGTALPSPYYHCHHRHRRLTISTATAVYILYLYYPANFIFLEQYY